MFGYSNPEVRAVRSRVFLGLFGTLLAAAAGSVIGQYVPPTLTMFLMFAEIVMVFVASFVSRRRAVGWTFVFAFSVISGITLTPILAYYTQAIGVQMVREAFIVTAVAFAVTAFVGSRKSLDFSWLGHLVFAALIVLLGLGVISFFIPFSSSLSFVYTYLGIAVFVGYLLFDVNRLTRYGVSAEQVPMVVLQLYLDFVNLFLFILRLFGLNVKPRS